jgi:NifU-like protein involved in Fe-S cluster formation
MSPLPNVFGYPTPIWQRFREPMHAGVLEPGVGVLGARAGTPASRSLIDLSVRLDPEGTVAEARFQAYGCPTTIAVGEWLAEQAQGRPLAVVGKITAAEIRASLEIAEERAHCAVLGEDLLRSLVQRVARS